MGEEEVTRHRKGNWKHWGMSAVQLLRGAGWRSCELRELAVHLNRYCTLWAFVNSWREVLDTHIQLWGQSQVNGPFRKGLDRLFCISVHQKALCLHILCPSMPSAHVPFIWHHIFLSQSQCGLTVALCAQTPESPVPFSLLSYFISISVHVPRGERTSLPQVPILWVFFIQARRSNSTAIFSFSVLQLQQSHLSTLQWPDFLRAQQWPPVDLSVFDCLMLYVTQLTAPLV